MERVCLASVNATDSVSSFYHEHFNLFCNTMLANVGEDFLGGDK